MVCKGHAPGGLLPRTWPAAGRLWCSNFSPLAARFTEPERAVADPLQGGFGAFAPLTARTAANRVFWLAALGTGGSPQQICDTPAAAGSLSGAALAIGDRSAND